MEGKKLYLSLGGHEDEEVSGGKIVKYLDLVHAKDQFAVLIAYSISLIL